VTAENVHAILRLFYNEPLLSMKDICTKTDLAQRTVSDIVNDMQKNNILMETSGFLRNKTYLLKDYVEAFRIFD
jgi:DNA-binding IclR family transcriptional regulator